MAKFIHTADIHLGSQLDAHLPRNKVEERRSEVRETFMRLATYASQNGVKAVIMSGDIFDDDKPLKKDKDFFYSVIKNHKDVDFLYLRGNHDSNAEYPFNQTLPNLKLFGDDWTYYIYDNVVIGGIELKESNKKSLYSSLNFSENTINIAMLHGQVATSEGKDNIIISNLKDKNIDYLALGHIHEQSLTKLDDRGEYCYSGCLEGRGFDETGVKGFMLLEVDSKVNATFVPFAQRQIVKIEADVTGLENSYDIYLLIKKISGECYDNLLRVILKGEIAFDNYSLDKDLESMLSRDYYCVSIKDKTTTKLDISSFEKDLSLKGEFVRVVYDNESLTDDEKRKILRIGIKALMGEKPND